MTEKTAQEIIELLTLNGRKPEHIKNGERVVYLSDAISIVRKALMTDHQPPIVETSRKKSGRTC